MLKCLCRIHFSLLSNNIPIPHSVSVGEHSTSVLPYVQKSCWRNFVFCVYLAILPRLITSELILSHLLKKRVEKRNACFFVPLKTAIKKKKGCASVRQNWTVLFGSSSHFELMPSLSFLHVLYRCLLLIPCHQQKVPYETWKSSFR